MPDPDDLHRLAPHVDNERATAAFRRRRRQARSYRRGAWAAGAMVLVVGASVLVAANVGDEDTLTRTGPAAPGDGPVTFEVLSVNPAADEMGTLRAATDDGEFVNLWKYANVSGPHPAVDFDTQVVVSITIPDDACPPELTEFTRDADVITPVFMEPTSGCDEPLIPKTYVVALDRAPLEPGFTLRLSADDSHGFAEQRLKVPLAGGLPVVWAQEPTDSQEGMAAIVQGTLSYDGVLGCFQVGDGDLRYPIVWPAGTVGVADGPGVRLPDGSVALVGDIVSGGGGYLKRDQRFDIPSACTPTDEVATFNPNGAVAVNPAAGAEDPQPACHQIELFVARLPDARINSDYQASESPEELLATSGLVLSGHLTGGFEVREASEDGGTDFVGYEVEVNAVYKGSHDLAGQQVVTIWVRVALSGVDAAAFQKTIAVGAPLVVFANPLSSNQGWTAAIEGLSTACPGEPPIGLTGTTGTWTELTSLDDLTARLEDASIG